MMVRWIQNLIWHLRDAVAGPNDFFQPCPRNHQVRLRVGGRIHLLCGWHGRRWARMPTVQHAQYGEIERGSGLGEDNLQVAVVEGGWGSPRQPPSKIGCFQDLWHRDNLMGNQQCRLHQLQNGVWGVNENRNIWSAPISKGGLVSQRWQGNLESNSRQSAEGSEWDEILRKCLTQEENRCRLPILAGL